jgi:hypothetical protein
MLAGITTMVDETKTMVDEAKTMVEDIKTLAKRHRPWSET